MPSGQVGLQSLEAIYDVFAAGERVADAIIFQQAVRHAAAGAAVAQGVVIAAALYYGMQQFFIMAAFHYIFCFLPAYLAIFFGFSLIKKK